MVPGLPGTKNTRFSREPPGSLRPPIGLRGHQDPPGNPPVPTRDPDAAVGHKGHIWRQRWGTRGTFGGSGGAHRAHLAAQRAQLASGHSGGGTTPGEHFSAQRAQPTNGGTARRAQMAGTAGTVGGESGRSWRRSGVQGRGEGGPGERILGSPGAPLGVPRRLFGCFGGAGGPLIRGSHASRPAPAPSRNQMTINYHKHQ